MPNENKSTRRKCVAVMLGCMVVGLFCLIYPIYVIWPFRAQGARELVFALGVIRVRSVAGVAAALAAGGALTIYWRTRPGAWRRVLTVIAVALVCGLAALSHVNIYEMMFHPETQPIFIAGAKANLDKDEKVIAVQIGAAARAYPVRNISYHHVINDSVDQTAIVATY